MHLISGAPYHLWSANHNESIWKNQIFQQTMWDPRGLPLREIGAGWFAHACFGKGRGW